MILNHPAVASIPCESCRTDVYDLKTGKRVDYPPGSGEWMKRPKSGPPCTVGPDVCPKVKPGHSDLTPQNRRVYEHWKRCRAIGQFPDDDLVAEHAEILNYIHGLHDNERLANLIGSRVSNAVNGR